MAGADSGKTTLSTRSLAQVLVERDEAVAALSKRRAPPATVKLGVPEEAFQNTVKKLARLYGWHGWHNSFSHGAVTGVHTLGLGDDHYDSNGFPDWLFIRGSKLLFRELKAKGRYLSQDQKRWFQWLTEAGQDVDVWRPGDEQKVIRAFAESG